jgi:serine/threonine-protein kinase RIO1
MTGEPTLLMVESCDGGAAAVAASLEEVAPRFGGRLRGTVSGYAVAAFGSVDAAAAAAAAVLQEHGERVRAALCHGSEPAVDEPGRLLSGARFGTVTVTSETAARLDRGRTATLVGHAPDNGAGRPVEQVLADVGHSRELRIGGLRLTGRRRRPSGEAAPLPRELRLGGKLAILGVALVTVIWITVFLSPASVSWLQRADQALLEWVVALRTDVATAVASVVNALGSPWLWRPLRFGVLLLLVAFKRWRHLLVVLFALFLVETLVEAMVDAIGRPRPLVPALAHWEGYAHPSAPVASLAVTLAIIAFMVLRPGWGRRAWIISSTVAVTALVVARVYLGIDHLTDGLVAAVLGVTLPLVLFRLLAPERVFPVTFRRGRGAHLEIDERRRAAIVQAVGDQLGLEVIDVEPFGLEASGGSTPLRLTVAGDNDGHLFAKLYSTSHLRADRWYKVARTILYGSLEDELRHPSVRRLVEREDYLLLTMRKAGIPCPRPYGVVEITPEREYLTVTEFLHDAQEISQAQVDEQIIDEGLAVIRRMWDAGLAHRDVKPGNVLIQHGHLRIVDVAFAMIRPSPWRQAVDLANMMLILALRTSPEQVYERALRFFAPEDIAEAFAATRSVTIPSESRSSLRLLARSQGIDLVKRFEHLSPQRERISIQRWSRRRIGLTLGALLGLGMLVPLVVQNLLGGGFL